MTTITQDYLNGIREGRAYLNMLRAAGEPIDPIRELAKADAYRAQFGGNAYSALGADFLNGERDFWRHQVAAIDTLGGR